MSGNEAPPKRKGIFYGWWLVVGTTIAMTFNGAAYFYGFSVFFNPLIKEFGWSRAALSGAFSVSRLEVGIAGPVVGYLVDRFGPRRLMIAGFMTIGVGFIVLSRINSIEMFYVVFVLLLSVGSSLGFAGPTSAAVANWFVRKRGLALGILMSGGAIGGVLVPVMAWVVGQYGWRTTSVICGIMFLIVGIPLSLVVRHKPEQYGYLPDGDDPDLIEVGAKSRTGAGDAGLSTDEAGARGFTPRRPLEEVNFSPKQAMKTGAFWLLSLSFTLRQMVTAGVAVHEIPALEDMGYSPEGAASILALMTLISIPGRLAFGWLGDHYDKRYVITGGLIMHFLGLIALAYASDLTLIVVFLLVFSPAYGGLIPLMPASYGAFFGRNSFATIYGLSQVVTMWGTIAGPLLAGYIFDVSGSYQFAFLIFAVANLLAIPPLVFVKMPKAKIAFQPIAH